MARKQSITARWLFNSLGIILIVLVVIEIVLAFSVREFYYNSVRQTLIAQAETITTVLAESIETPYSDFDRDVRDVIEGFDKKEQMELMALGPSGDVIVTSSGFDVDDLYLPDFELATEQFVGEYQGRLGEENVMAVTALTPVENESVAAVRLIVSMSNVDETVTYIVVIALLVGAAIVFFVLISGLYFINSIVLPIGEIGKTARNIAEGNFSARLTKKNNDEVGELCDIINHMANELGNADKMKNDFISSVSHELRTPLTAIKGWGETILSDMPHTEGEDTTTFKQGMNVILKETDRLSLMVEELLDFSRMQSGRMILRLTKIDIIAELSEAVLMYSERARREGIELIYDENEDSGIMTGDANRLRQVFTNILDNAIKYSDPEGTVEVSARNMGDSTTIVVSDSGLGISPDDLPKIKNKFYKANLTRRGSGIGLAVADEIVKLHGGTLELTSELGEGTTVTINLPHVPPTTPEENTQK